MVTVREPKRVGLGEGSLSKDRLTADGPTSAGGILLGLEKTSCGVDRKSKGASATVLT